MWGAVRRLTRFSIGSFLWLSLLAAVLVLWYLDRERLLKQIAIRNGTTGQSWSIRQIVGPPDTIGFGDFVTAWASASPDSGEEWVVVEFGSTANAVAVEIYETYNPGAVIRIAHVGIDGTEELLWQGVDPLANSLLGGGIAKIAFSKQVRTRRIKIVLATGSHPGWNELDAVALIDDGGQRQWVTQAWASSSFGTNRKIASWFWP